MRRAQLVLLLEMSRSATWCFTLNNYRVQDGKPVLDMSKFPGLEFGVFQPEVAPSTGTPHLQGYLRFKSRRTLGKVQSVFLPEKPHLSVAKGTDLQNDEYCSKESSRAPGGEVVRYGECPLSSRGSRKDIRAVRDSVLAGAKFLDLVKDDDLLPVVARHMPFTNRLLQEAAVPILRPELRVTFCYGPAGVGKSTCAGVFKDPETTYCYDGNSSGRFWDGYTSQPKLILDEFSGHVLTPTMFNRICDKGPVKVDVKNGAHYLAAVDIRVTANYMPSSWWSDRTQYNKEALARRIHVCHYHSAIGECKEFQSDADGYSVVKMEMYLASIGAL